VAAGRVTVEAERKNPDVNLIGKTVDEALEEFDRAVNRALVSGIDRFRVIHGRGSGALRKAIRERIEEDRHLRRHPEEEQDDAVTWVEVI
jgi:DNA mismatch repair protein MutS2